MALLKNDIYILRLMGLGFIIFSPNCFVAKRGRLNGLLLFASIGMKTKELIKVFIRTEQGRTVCICHAGHKRCKRPCAKDLVERDKFREWEQTFQRNKYGI